MRRRHVVIGLATLLAAPAAAQEPGRVWRIGFLSLASQQPDQTGRWLAAFRDGLRALGYVEGRNAVIEERYAAGRVDRLSALASELVALTVDVLVAAPAGSALAAKTRTSAMPIVFDCSAAAPRSWTRSSRAPDPPISRSSSPRCSSS